MTPFDPPPTASHDAQRRGRAALVPVLPEPLGAGLVELLARSGWATIVIDVGAAGVKPATADPAYAEAARQLDAAARRNGLRVIVRTDEPSEEAVDIVDVLPSVLLLLQELRGEADPATPTARPALVLVSGMLGDETLWAGVIPLLLEHADVRTCRIDLDDTVAGMASTLLATAPDRFSVVGHSLGAIVAVEVARQAPARVTGLALVNASGRPASPDQLAGWSGLAERVDAGDFPAVADELAAATLPASRRGDASLLAANRRMADSVGPEGLRRQLAAQATRPDGLAAAGALTIPVLVVTADRDDVCAIDRQEELVAAFADARHVVVPGAGHMLPLEDPQALAAELLTWVMALR